MEADTLDIESASDDLAADILGTEPPAPDPVDGAIDAAAATETPAPSLSPSQETPAVEDALPPPKSWKSEMHPIWDKLSKGVALSPDESKQAAKYYGEREKQMLDGIDGYKSDAEFAKTIRHVTQPYEGVLKSQGLDAPTAVNYLLNAHVQMTNGTPEQRAAFFQKMAERYQIPLGAMKQPDPNAPQLPAEVREALARVERLEGAMTAKEQAEFAEVRQAKAKEVEVFASDPAHPYFDEVADDIVAMLKAGHTLKDAYEKAVWANPVTRQKEIARIQTETEKANREKAKETVAKAKKATSANVRGRETNRAPTAPVGSMDDVLSETLAEIRSR
jgi:hypothetical protein